MVNSIGEVKQYGPLPRSILLLHGGPGAPGEMRPVAEALSIKYGVLEPYQSSDSVWGQVNELYMQINRYAEKPVTLVGYSWGAWLAYLFVSKYSEMVKKVILVSSGPFEQKYVSRLEKNRSSRLSDAEIKRLKVLEKMFSDPNIKDRDKLFSEFGNLMSKADTYNRNGEEKNYTGIKPDFNIYKSVWTEASQMRESGELLNLGNNISCEVVAIHGDYDPHQYEGVRDPLKRVLKHFKFILLSKCGHHPWFEIGAKDEFYNLLKSELK